MLGPKFIVDVQEIFKQQRVWDGIMGTLPLAFNTQQSDKF